MKIVEVGHPLVQHKLGLMRRADNSTKTFRELVAEVATLLTYEATADLETEEAEVAGWAALIDDGTLNRGDVLLGIANSAEMAALVGVMSTSIDLL